MCADIYRDKIDLEVKRLRDLKIPWADIARKLNRPQHIIQDRFYKRRAKLEGRGQQKGEYSVPKSENEKRRRCNFCKKEFTSWGPGNRTCEPCRNSPLYRELSSASGVFF